MKAPGCYIEVTAMCRTRGDLSRAAGRNRQATEAQGLNSQNRERKLWVITADAPGVQSFLESAVSQGEKHWPEAVSFCKRPENHVAAQNRCQSQVRRPRATRTWSWATLRPMPGQRGWGATATLSFFITAGEGAFTVWTALVCDISIDRFKLPDKKLTAKSEPCFFC